MNATGTARQRRAGEVSSAGDEGFLPALGGKRDWRNDPDRPSLRLSIIDYPQIPLARRIAAATLGVLLGLAFVVCVFLLSGCGEGMTRINPARTELSQRVTYDKSGNPVSAVSSASAVGPSMTSNAAKDFAGELGTPELTLAPLPGNPVPPAGPGAAGAGNNRVSAAFFSPTSGAGRWVLFALGGLCIVVGGGIAYFLPFCRMLGIGIAAVGAFIIAAAFYPVLWILVVLGLAGWVVLDVLQSRKAHGSNQVARAAVDLALKDGDAPHKSPILAYINNASDAASREIQRQLAGIARRGKLNPKPDAPSDPVGSKA